MTASSGNELFPPWWVRYETTTSNIRRNILSFNSTIYTEVKTIIQSKGETQCSLHGKLMKAVRSI